MLIQLNKNERRVMDLGITSKKEIICASSQGLDKACALTLAEEGA